MPKLMTEEGMVFPTLLTENSLRLRVMLEMREKTNQFMGLFYHFFYGKETLGREIFMDSSPIFHYE
jgi:hypothetical protein